MVRNATISDVACSVATCAGAANLNSEQVLQIVDFAIRKAIALNCFDGNTLHINLDNRHVLICEVKRSVGPTDV